LCGAGMVKNSVDMVGSLTVPVPHCYAGCSVADLDPVSATRCFFIPRIRDKHPGSTTLAVCIGIVNLKFDTVPVLDIGHST
jgi:hypothetical protein